VQVVLLGGLACLAALAVHSYPLTYPILNCDDFQILIRSWTWSATQASLWQPANEHAMPLGRLTTWVVVQLAGRPTGLPGVTALQGPLAMVVGMWLVYLFVRRELGHPLYGLIALVLFGVSSTYEQAVNWFAASFSVLALDTIVLALLAAQRWRLTGRRRYLAWTVFWVVLAPTWFASGILAGPLCALYLLLPEEGGGALPPQDDHPPAPARRRLVVSALLALVPLMGTVVFLAVSLPLTAKTIMHLEHYGNKTALEALHPDIGLLYTERALVDNLVPGLCGIGGVTCPIEWVPIALVALASAALGWWLRAPRRRLLLLGLGMILSSYLLVYTARSEWEYDWMREWTRYNLLPHLGLVLFVCGGLPRWLDRGRLHADGRLSGRQALAVIVLAALLLVCHFPRVFFAECWHLRGTPEQHLAALRGDPIAWLEDIWAQRHNPLRAKQIAVLRRIEEVDALCRRHRIAGETAREALEGGSAEECLAMFAVAPDAGFPATLAWSDLALRNQWPWWLDIPLCAGRENGWDFVRGSDDPRQNMTVAEAWRLINADDAFTTAKKPLKKIASSREGAVD
jgi:hypothetical protein